MKKNGEKLLIFWDKNFPSSKLLILVSQYLSFYCAFPTKMLLRLLLEILVFIAHINGSKKIPSQPLSMHQECYLSKLLIFPNFLLGNYCQYVGWTSRTIIESIATQYSINHFPQFLIVLQQSTLTKIFDEPFLTNISRLPPNYLLKTLVGIIALSLNADLDL